MAKTKEPFNPFYALVVLVGVAFAVTTFAYATMAYRASTPAAEIDKQPGLMSMVDRYGVSAMGIELGLLGAATLGAMGLDRLRSRRGDTPSGNSEEFKRKEQPR